MCCWKTIYDGIYSSCISEDMYSWVSSAGGTLWWCHRMAACIVGIITTGQGSCLLEPTDSWSPRLTWNFHSLICVLKHLKAQSDKPTRFSTRLIRMLWLIVLNTALRIDTLFPSKRSLRSLIISVRPFSVVCFLLNLTKIPPRYHFLLGSNLCGMRQFFQVAC